MGSIPTSVSPSEQQLSSKDLEVPVSDIVSLAFEKQVEYDDAQPLYVDAEDSSRSISYPETRSLVRRLIAGLRASGLQTGDAVVVHLGNDYIYSALFLAIVGAGGVHCGSNPAYQAFELNHIVQLATPKLLITSQDSLATVLEVCEDRDISRDRIFLYDRSSSVLPTDKDAQERSTAHSTNGAAQPLSRSSNELPAALEAAVQPFTNLLEHGEIDWVKLDHEAAMKATPAAYYSTSGTSGLPKLAVHTHYSIVAQHEALHVPPTPPYTVRRLACLPLFHLFGAAWAHLTPLRYGQPLFVMRRFELESYAGHIAQHDITETQMVPPIVHALNGYAGPLRLRELLDGLRLVTISGAPIDAVALGTLREKLLHPEATLSLLWGMTEIGVGTRFTYGEQDDSGSCGRPIPGVELRIGDGEARNIGGTSSDVLGSEVGELSIRTKGLTIGYRGVHFDQDWFCTGDIARISAGKLYIVGRVKELIKVKGWQVAPAELEAVLLQHPEICDCAVVGTLSSDGVTEVPRAYVVRRKKLQQQEKEPVTAQEVYDFARQRLASYKKLGGGVVFVEAIPKTASGKIQRFKLLQMDHYRQHVTSLLLASTTTGSSTPAAQQQQQQQQQEEGGVAGKKRKAEGANEFIRRQKRRLSASKGGLLVS